MYGSVQFWLYHIGDHDSSAICNTARAVAKLYLDSRTRKSPVHSPNHTLGGLYADRRGFLVCAQWLCERLVRGGIRVYIM